MTVIAIAAGSAVTFNVEGTYQTYPSFVVSGVVNLSNAASGAKVSTGAVSVPGGTILDMLNRMMKSGSTNLYNAITPESVWWSLQPGTNTIANNGTGTATMTFHGAWL